MPSLAAKTAPPEKIALYEKLLATNPKVERKGDTVPYTSVNGNMSSYLSKEGSLALRLGSMDRQAFILKYKARLSKNSGVAQPEYVEVPPDLLEKTKELKKWFELSYEYVSSLKPKPTKKAKKAAKP